MAATQELGADALTAMARGDLAAARAALEEQLAAGESPQLHEALSWVCLTLEDLRAARRHGEAAYRLHSDAGSPCRAAAAAMAVACVHDIQGQEAAVRGWLRRAERLLDQAGPCVERGYLELARAGCDVRDVSALEAGAERALAIARRFADPDLEARALAEGGLALVSQGRIAEGLSRLDEAMASVVGGDVRQHLVAGITCCAMFTACERLGDLARADQWTRAVEVYARERFGEPPPPVLRSHCRLVHGHLLSASGRWQEAEEEFRRAIETSQCVSKGATARGGIALLCIGQGRFFDAEQLLAGWEDRFEVTEAMARLHLARGELAMAEATLERALLPLETDLLSSAPLLALHAEIEIELGDLDMAATSAARLRWIAFETRIPTLAALAQLTTSQVASARGGSPLPALRAAAVALAGDICPPLSARVHTELARALTESDPPAAIAEARCALAIFERLGARHESDRVASMLRALGVPVRFPRGGGARDLDALSRREREVLPLLAEGLSNADIAQRLFITTKTAEHHVSSILAKLGLRSRSEVAAYTARAFSAPG